MNIGKSVIIKGELSGSEDLTIEGQVEGKIELRQNLLTIGPNAKIKAQVFAKTVVVEGQVHGNISASERIDIRDKGSVEGDLSSPRVAIADGAHFRGSIDMQQAARAATSRPRSSRAVGVVAPAPMPAAYGRVPAPARRRGGKPRARRLGVAARGGLFSWGARQPAEHSAPERPLRAPLSSLQSSCLPSFLAALSHVVRRRSCSISVPSSAPTCRSSANGWRARC